MRRLKLLVSSALLLFCAGEVRAQSAETVSDSLYSNALGEEMTFRVSLPEGYSPNKKYICTYVLDTHGLYDLAVANARFDNYNFGVLPPMIVVAVDYKPMDHRVMVGLYDETHMQLDSLGQKFQQYIANELIPHIDAKYATAKRFLLGHSWTGIFSLWWMLNSPDTFSGYMMLCPADDEPVPQSLLDKIDIRGHRVSIVGAQNDDPHRLVFADSLTHTFARQTPYVYHTVVAGEDHMSVIPSAVSKALRSMFMDATAAGMGDSVKLSQHTLWQLYKQADSLDRVQYGIPFEKSNNNLQAIMYITEVRHDDAESFRCIAEDFADSTLTALNAFNIAYIFKELQAPEDELTWLNRAVDRSRLHKQGNQDAFTEVMARCDRALDYLAAYKHDYAAAWQALDSLAADIPQHKVVPLYAQGGLSATYNFRCKEGLKSLDKCLTDSAGMSTWGRSAEAIAYLRAQCLMNLGKYRDALATIDTLLKSPTRAEDAAQYTELKAKIEAKLKK